MDFCESWSNRMLWCFTNAHRVCAVPLVHKYTQGSVWDCLFPHNKKHIKGESQLSWKICHIDLIVFSQAWWIFTLFRSLLVAAAFWPGISRIGSRWPVSSVTVLWAKPIFTYRERLTRENKEPSGLEVLELLATLSQSFLIFHASCCTRSRLGWNCWITMVTAWDQQNIIKLVRLSEEYMKASADSWRNFNTIVRCSVSFRRLTELGLHVLSLAMLAPRDWKSRLI